MRKLQVIVGGVQLLDYCDCIVHSCMAGLLTSTMAYDFVLFVVVVGFSSFHVFFYYYNVHACCLVKASSENESAPYVRLMCVNDDSSPDLYGGESRSNIHCCANNSVR